MFSRLLFLLLFAGNITLAMWIVFEPRAPQSVPAVTEPGIASLILLSERGTNTQQNTASKISIQDSLHDEPKGTVDVSDNLRCLRLGPFTTQVELQEAMHALTPVVKRQQFKEQVQVQSRGYLVYLAALSSREKALEVARQLNARGVRDYYVVTAGNQQNSISLGLFRDRNNAERRMAEVTLLGFKPVITERTEQLPNYWLEFAISSNTTFSWRDYVRSTPVLKITEMACF